MLKIEHLVDLCVDAFEEFLEQLVIHNYQNKYPWKSKPILSISYDFLGNNMYILQPVYNI